MLCKLSGGKGEPSTFMYANFHFMLVSAEQLCLLRISLLNQAEKKDCVFAVQ